MLTKHEQRYQLAVQQVEQLQNDVKGLQQKDAAIGDDDEALTSKLKEEVAELKFKVISIIIACFQSLYLNSIHSAENDSSIMESL